MPPFTIQKLQTDQKSGGFSTSKGMFPAGLTINRRFADVDELAAAIRHWDEEGVQLVPGPFSARLNLLHTSAMQIHRAQLSSAIRVRGSAVPGSIVFGLQTSGTSPALWRGRPIDADSVVMFDGRTEINFQTCCPSEVTVVSIDKRVLAEHLEQSLGWMLPDRAFEKRLKMTAAKVASLIRNWSELTDAGHSLSCHFTDEHFARHFEATVVDSLPFNSMHPTHEPRAIERRRIAHQARKHMLLHMDEPMSISAICRAVNGTERTLHLAFRESFGTTPKKFLKNLRMNVARRALEHPNPGITVTEVALGLGLFHLARFAEDYRKRFAELPSETLRRVTGCRARSSN